MNKPASSVHASTRSIVISGGKGGTGKTTVACHLAAGMAKRHPNKQVLLFDADLSLANVNLLLGLKAEKTIADVLQGHCHLQDVFIQGPAGVWILPGASGVHNLSSLSSLETAGLIRAFSQLPFGIDYLFIDTAAGMSKQVLQFINASQEVMMVVADDPSSVMDAYAMIKVLNKHYHNQKFWILSNMVVDEQRGKALFCKLSKMCNQFLDVTLYYCGHLPFDQCITMSAKQRQLVTDAFPGSAASVACERVLERLDMLRLSNDKAGSITYFFENYFNLTGCNS